MLLSKVLCPALRKSTLTMLIPPGTVEFISSTTLPVPHSGCLRWTTSSPTERYNFLTSLYMTDFLKSSFGTYTYQFSPFCPGASRETCGPLLDKKGFDGRIIEKYRPLGKSLKERGALWASREWAQ